MLFAQNFTQDISSVKTTGYISPNEYLKPGV